MRRLVIWSTLFLASGVLAACTNHRWLPLPTEGAVTTLTDLTAMSQLQAKFNQDQGRPRLILLVSPT